MGNVPTQNDHDTIQGKERVKVLGSISFDPVLATICMLEHTDEVYRSLPYRRRSAV